MEKFYGLLYNNGEKIAFLSKENMWRYKMKKGIWKRIVTILLVFAMALSLIACAGQVDEEEQEDFDIVYKFKI